MRISDWSSDVCSSDLSSGEGGARLFWRRFACTNAGERAGDTTILYCEATLHMATKVIDGGTRKRRISKVFGDIHEVVQMPTLIALQRESYEQFMRSDASIGYVSALHTPLRTDSTIRRFSATPPLDF